MTKKNKKLNHTSIKIVSYWFSIPRILRVGFLWLILIVLSIFGWIKIFKS